MFEAELPRGRLKWESGCAGPTTLRDGLLGLDREEVLLLGGFLILLGFFDFAFADFVAFAHERLLLV
jgi:hypothetical protein